MLGDRDVTTMVPVKDAAEAAKFFEHALGLTRLDSSPTVIRYRSGSSTLIVYESQTAGTNEATTALWTVDDLEATVRELKARGVTFEHYDDLPGVDPRRRHPRPRCVQDGVVQGPDRQHVRSQQRRRARRARSLTMASPTLGSILLGTADPDRLRDWYAAALAPGDERGRVHRGDAHDVRRHVRRHLVAHRRAQ